MQKYLIRLGDGRFFVGYPARFSNQLEKARTFWSMRGATTAKTHLYKRLERAGIGLALEIVTLESVYKEKEPA